MTMRAATVSRTAESPGAAGGVDVLKGHDVFVSLAPGVLGLTTTDDVDDEWQEPGWQDRSLCSQTDPEAFFPEKGGSTREAKKVCRGCEVRAECLEYALEHDERFGIWGGLSERERRRLKREAG
jgi:WhiB family transcriptional regulator, redox-sensing transcriptional regulator